MDKSTGEIHVVKDEAEAKRRGLVAVTAKQLRGLRAMTPAERVAWAERRAEVRAALRGLTRHPLASLPEETPEQARARRNAAKRARKARG